MEQKSNHYSKILTSRNDPESNYYSFFIKKDWWENQKKAAKGQLMNHRIVDALELLEKYDNGEIKTDEGKIMTDLKSDIAEMTKKFEQLKTKIDELSSKIDNTVMELIKKVK